MTTSDVRAGSDAGSDIAGPILGAPQPTPTDAARRLLMSILAATLAFVVIGSFAYAVYASTNVMTWLQVVLPVVSGLVGAAGGFYFGQLKSLRPPSLVSEVRGS